MKGDFTKAVFEPLKHFVRVLLQQGRVTLDADSPDPTGEKNRRPQALHGVTPPSGRNAEIRKPD